MVIGLGLLGLLVGCKSTSDSLPKTYPVTGTVLDEKGAPVKGGAVRFESTTDTTLTVTGEIQQDGKFTMRTSRNKESAEGAIEGEYTVLIMLPAGADPNNPPPPVKLPKTYKVEPKDNVFTLQLGK